MQYVTLDHCRNAVFRFIYEKLSSTEPSAQYEQESNGLAELDKVLHLVESDSFYPTFADKAAYLLCSIAGSQYFSNGNKRLGATVLMQFRILNNAKQLVLAAKKYQKLLAKFFPKHSWESNPTIVEADPLFLYNLAIVIGDRTKWGQNVDFTVLKQKVSAMFSQLYFLPKSLD